MTWEQIASMGLEVRPFDGSKPPATHSDCRFDTPVTKTLALLRRELSMLDANRIVVELDIRDQDIRLDGYPKANARISNPAVAISFDSKHGPLRYATCAYDDWRNNLRAIALSLEALRAVDRHEVSRRGEQYRGWKAIAASSAEPEDLIQTAGQAREYLAEKFDGDLKRGLFETHPDHGGTTDEFRKVMRCKELLA